MNDICMIDNFINFNKNPTIDNLKEVIKLLHNNGKSVNEIFVNIWGMSLLDINQPYETMKYLLNMGGNPNLQSYIYEFKPIHFQYNYKTIKLLVDRGASPNPTDISNFNPLFWQKDPESMDFLLRYNSIYNSNVFFIDRNISVYHPYIRMLIDGGYDPYSEQYITITPLFLQNNIKTIEIMIKFCNYHNILNLDIVNESVLFKPKINPDIIKLFAKYTDNNINYQNIIGNTPLHVQYIPENIISLLENKADYKIKNDENLTPYDFHFKRNNLYIANIIERYSSAKIIQNCWRKFWFHKNYIKPKFYKIKKIFLEDFKLLPPSQCGIFPGGIEYQNAFDDFKLCTIHS